MLRNCQHIHDLLHSFILVYAGSTTPIVVGGGNGGDNGDNGGTQVGQCDPADYGLAGLGPYSDDCTKFYQCTTGGILYLMDCPAGLNFNPSTLVCDTSVCGAGGNGGCKYNIKHTY